ncbi:MAG: polysaccharide deacetylase family protein [Candidatus Omnitrophica bacterium]|nr:polysaccharide deacetylase family protein [Candidatus Omnitrophota bacterium]
MLRGIFFTLFRIANADYFLRQKTPNQLYILIFHQVNDSGFTFYPALPNHAFEQICKFFSERFNVIYFSEVADYFKKTRKPGVIMTFDDGHYDILENAYPVLKKYKLKFNINIATESLETGLPQDSVRVYNVLNTTEKNEYINTELFSEPIKISIDKKLPTKTEAKFFKLFKKIDKKQQRMLADDIVEKLASKTTKFSRMLSRDDVVYLSKNGAEIGSHTHSHPLLPNIDTASLEFELSHSKKVLENLCGKGIDIIAYPRGMYNETVIQKSFELGYKYILLTENRHNVINDPEKESSLFYRVGLYHKTPDESLAKVFGFHRTVHGLKNRLRRG